MRFAGETLKLIYAESNTSETISPMSQILMEVDFENARLKSLQMLKGVINNPQNAEELKNV